MQHNYFLFQIDDRDFTVEINAYLIVKWIDERIQINIPNVSKDTHLFITLGFMKIKYVEYLYDQRHLVLEKLSYI